MSSPLKSNVPDGGWGWVVVGAVALINMTNQSISSVFGLLFGGHLAAMNQDTSAAALITNLNSLTLNLSGLFIGPAIKNFSPRIVATVGCILISCGLVVCAFSMQVWQIIAGYSLLCGIGQGLIAPSTFMVINTYFTTKRGRAVGVSLAGSGLGQVMIPHIVRVFLINYGFCGAALSMATFSLVGLIGTAMFKPLKTAQPKFNSRKDANLLLQAEKGGKLAFEVKIVRSDADTKHKSTTRKLCSKICHRLVEAMDLELLKDPVFWSIIVGIALVYTATTNFTMLFPLFLQHSVGLTIKDTAFCMSIIAGADICCRLLLPFITDKLKIPYRVTFLLGIFGMLASRIVLAESTTMTSIIFTSILTGISKSTTVVNNNLAVSSYCRPEKLAGGLGLSMISKAALVMTVGQLLGWIRDYTGSYVMCLHSQTVVMVAVAVVWTPEILYRHWKQQRKVQEVVNADVEEGECAKMNERGAC